MQRTRKGASVDAPFLHPLQLDEESCAQALGLHVRGIRLHFCRAGVYHSWTMCTIT